MSKPVDEMTYEEAYTELQSVVETLESGQKPLEESLGLFERGQALIKHCAGLLGKAELKVRLVSGEELPDLAEE